eukprot:1108243-Prorocentrum_minimum.AAC.1
MVTGGGFMLTGDEFTCARRMAFSPMSTGLSSEYLVYWSRSRICVQKGVRRGSGGGQKGARRGSEGGQKGARRWSEGGQKGANYLLQHAPVLGGVARHFRRVVRLLRQKLHLQSTVVQWWSESTI